MLSSQYVIFGLNSSYTRAILGSFEELTGKTCKMIEPWSLNHPHGLLQLCKETTGQGQRTNAVTEWAHCQRQVAFLQ